MDEPAEALPERRQRPVLHGRPRGLSLRDLTSMLTRFSIVGAVKAVLDIGTFNLVLLLAGVESLAVVLLANTAGFSVSVAASFALNARYTFRVAAQRGGFRRYVLISVVGLAMYNGTLALIMVGAEPEGTLAVNAAKIGALGLSMCWNFLGYWRFVFRPRLEELPRDRP